MRLLTCFVVSPLSPGLLVAGSGGSPAGADSYPRGARSQREEETTQEEHLHCQLARRHQFLGADASPVVVQHRGCDAGVRPVLRHAPGRHLDHHHHYDFHSAEHGPANHQH